MSGSEIARDFDVQAAVACLKMTFLEAIHGGQIGIPIQIDPAGPQSESLRHSSLANLYFRTDRFARFWFRQYNYVALGSAILLHSAWLNGGKAIPISLKNLSRDTGLSAPTVGATLAKAEVAGHIKKHRSENDHRLIVIEPKQSFLVFMEAVHADLAATAAALTGRPDSFARLSAADQVHFHRLACSIMAGQYRNLPKKRPSIDGKSFVFTMWDVAIRAPQEPGEFVTDQAARLKVTPQTIRNIVVRGRELGWLEDCAELRLTPMGMQRIGLMLSVIRARWDVILAASDHPGALSRLDVALTRSAGLS